VAAGNSSSSRLITALMLAVATVGATIFAISPLLLDIAQAFDVSAAQVAILPGAFSLSLALVAPLVALTAQRLPRARLIVWGLLIFGLAWLLALMVSDFRLMTLLAMLAGGATGAVLPATYASAADLSSYAQRARTMGRIVSGWSMAILLVVPMMALASQAISWRWAFGALAGCAIAIALWLSSLGRHWAVAPRTQDGEAAIESEASQSFADPHQMQSPQDAVSVMGSLRSVLADPSIRILLLVNLLDMGAFYAVYSFAGTELRRLNDWGASAAGLAMAAYGLGLAIMTFNGRWIDLLGKRRAAIVALLSLSLVLAMLPWLASFPWAMVVGIIVWGIVQGAFFTAITSLATEQIPPLRGVVVALLSASTYLGVTLYTPVTAWLYGSFGYAAVGLEAACGCALAAFLLLFTRGGRRAEPGRV
jgi:DHA1 family inner membrane transport protein